MLRWSEWAPARSRISTGATGVPRLSTPAAVSAAPLADVARMVTAILRAERFTDGIIARMLDEGILFAAADRILAALTAAP